LAAVSENLKSYSYMSIQNMIRKTTLAIIAATALAITLIAMSMTTSAFASNGQTYAPGQRDPHNNPSGDRQPPGNNNEESLGNPGQCQKFLNGPAFDIDKEQAHSECH
jgi:hypothetical protein